MRATWLGVVVAATALSACAQPDRSDQARTLEQAMAAMPGVQQADVRYTNDFSLGSNLDIEVIAKDADTAQIVAVAAAIEDRGSQDFDGYDRTATLVVAEGGVLERHGTLDPASLGEEARTVREILREIPGAEVGWVHRGAAAGHSIGFGSAPAGVALAAVRSRVAVDDLTVTIGEFGDEPRWTVRMPFDMSEEQQVRGAVGQIPMTVQSLVVEDGHAAMATVLVEDESRAETDLDAVIAAFAPTEDRPLMLEWQDVRADRDEREFSGRVHVAGCAYPSKLGESDPERFYTVEAMKLRDRLRAQYDTCN
jgi:hypothetical protein